MSCQGLNPRACAHVAPVQSLLLAGGGSSPGTRHTRLKPREPVSGVWVIDLRRAHVMLTSAAARNGHVLWYCILCLEQAAGHGRRALASFSSRRSGAWNSRPRRYSSSPCIDRGPRIVNPLQKHPKPRSAPHHSTHPHSSQVPYRNGEQSLEHRPPLGTDLSKAGHQWGDLTDSRWLPLVRQAVRAIHG